MNQEDPEPDGNTLEESLPLGDHSVQATVSYKDAATGSGLVSSLTEHKETRMRISQYKSKPEAIHFFTGFQNYSHFTYFFGCLQPAISRLKYQSRKVSVEDELFLTLMKLRTDKCDVELGILFGFCSSVAGHIFINMVQFLYYHLQEVTLWLPKDIVMQYMPTDFERMYQSARVILDATECFIDVWRYSPPIYL